MNFTVFVVDWYSLGPAKFLLFMAVLVTYTVWSEWRRG